MGVVSSIVGSTLGQIFGFVAQWVASGAGWLLTQVGHVMSSTTTVDLASSWFSAHERAVAALSAALVLPMACCGAIVAVYRQDASLLVRGFLVKLPLALLLTGVAVELVRIGLTLSDRLSSYVLQAGGRSGPDLLAALAAALAAGAALPTVPPFVVFIGALLLAVSALVLWLELVVRAAAVAAATLFLPLALAGLVWPATAHWCRRLGETIAALVLSKLVVAAVLSLAAGAVWSGISGPSDTSGGFSSVVVGIALLAMATTSPFVLLRLVPAIEAGAVMHLESGRHRLQHLRSSSVRTADLATYIATGHGLLQGPPAGAPAPEQDVGPPPRPFGGIPPATGDNQGAGQARDTSVPAAAAPGGVPAPGGDDAGG